ncbi:putative methyltransferase-like protein 7A [Mercenaria mercenaria]|uniref:putative methyltransferase-like protein 7A n=1 Tax=Mercenaria mercenaria TaxID=6596 RepID=UPI00234F6C55|nr:putative methyltransferase-like protein 7A [Mercenaria mercenaria]
MENIGVQINLYKTGIIFAILGVICYVWRSVGYRCFRRFYAWNINRETYMNELLSEEKLYVFQFLHEYQEKAKPTLTVLEVGSGPAVNLTYYPQNTKLICLDPNSHFAGYIEENMKKCNNVVEIDFVQGFAENIPFECELFDAAVCSFALCTVNDIGRSLKEIKRVLKPGGKLVFLEHVTAKDKYSWTYILQLAYIPLAWLIYGCRSIVRDTEKSVRDSGFSDVQMHCVRPKCAPLWLNTCVMGIATK